MRWRRVVGALAVAMLLALSLVGCLAAPAAPMPQERGYVGPCYLAMDGAGLVCNAGGGVTLNSGAVLTVGEGATVTLKGAAFSGPIRFGSATSVVSGTEIAHGLATTPTVVALTAGSVLTTPLYVQALNATSLTVGVVDGVTVDVVYWWAGK